MRRLVGGSVPPPSPRSFRLLRLETVGEMYASGKVYRWRPVLAADTGVHQNGLTSLTIKKRRKAGKDKIEISSPLFVSTVLRPLY